MDDFIMYDTCLDNRPRLLHRYVETDLVLNFKKHHFMIE